MNGGTAVLDADEDATLQILVQNTASAEWLSGEKTGGVQFVSSKESAAEFHLPLPVSLTKRGRVRFTVFCGSASGRITGMLTAANRTAFGDRLDVTIIRSKEFSI